MNMMHPPKGVFGFRLSAELRGFLDQICARFGMGRAEALRFLILRAAEEFELTEPKKAK